MDSENASNHDEFTQGNPSRPVHMEIGCHDGKNLNSRRMKALSYENIKEDMKISCTCSRACFELLDEETVIIWRRKYHSGGKGLAQQQRLLELYTDTIFSRKHGSRTHLVNGQLFCSFVWYKKILGVSRSTYARMIMLEKRGVKYIQAKNRGHQRSLGQIALGFMQHYVDMVGDHNPENGRTMLPAGLCIQNIYKKFCESHGKEIVKKSRFYQLWKEKMSHVTHQKDCRMSKCNVCVLARHMLEQSQTEEVRQSILADREEHLKRQRKEREAYYERRASAVDNPCEKTSIIIDGMDQSKTNIPHFRGWAPPKELDPASLLQTHITGALVHGKSAFMFIDVLQWPHDANLTINCMLNCLVAQARNRRLTKTLYIQLDNCGRENKNKFVLGLLALLVAKKYVKEVIVSFLMVGHTHEDIDARFSRISAKLKRADAKTLPQLLGAVVEAQTMITNRPFILKSVFNVRDWIKDYLVQLNNHSYPHAFRIYEDERGHAVMKYKNWSSDDVWLPHGERGVDLFKVDSSGNQSFPVGQPDMVIPDFTRKHDFDKLRENIRKCKKYLTNEEMEWWNSFIDDPISVLNSQDNEEQHWYFHHLEPLQCVLPSIEAVHEVSPLDVLMHKERAMPEVHAGPRRRCNATVPQTIGVVSSHKGSMIGAIDRGHLRIGKVTGIDMQTVTIELYRGTLNGKWHPVQRQGMSVQEIIDKNTVNEDWIFLLSQGSKLPTQMKKVFAPFL